MKRVFLLCIIMTILAAQVSWSAIPETMSYQGKLTDGSGNAVADGNYSLTFNIYDVSAGGSALWTETHGDVATVNGIFNVILGSDTLLDIAFDKQYWLGIKVGGGAELTPRIKLTSSPYSLGGNFWSLTGNAGTSPPTNFLGTTDNTPLEFWVNGLRALRLEPHTASPNIIGGVNGNWITSGIFGATIAGGGQAGALNRVTDAYGVVGGGKDNQAGDGDADTANAPYATVGGGLGNDATGDHATVGGGGSNTAEADYGTVGGGYRNTVSSNPYATVSGGYINTAAGLSTTVGGGSDNHATDFYATVGGGVRNDATGFSATVGGGSDNYVTDSYCTISGGGSNQAGNDAGTTADATYATVAGGENNTASGFYSTIPGGRSNTAQGYYSFAAGRMARANHRGSFVWGDAHHEAVESTGDNRFIVRAMGGVYLYTNSALSSGMYLSGGGSSWNIVSDRAMKRNIRQVDGKEILSKLAQIPISQWSYKAQDPSIEHIGPVAQDFYAAFGLGEDDKHINTLDPDGVALAAIQGLYDMVKEKDAENADLRQCVDDLESRLVALEVLVSSQEGGQK